MKLLHEYYPLVGIVLGLAALLYALMNTSTKSELLKSGIKVQGIVFKQDRNQYVTLSNIGQGSSVKDLISIRFVTLDQEWITAPINQDFQSFYSWQYKDGEAVTVYYEKGNPNNFYVSSKQSKLQGRFFFAFLGISLIVGGLIKFFSS